MENKLHQLEFQLSYAVIRYHLKNDNDFVIPTCPLKHETWMCAEVLKLVAFAGVTVISIPSPQLLKDAAGFVEKRHHVSISNTTTATINDKMHALSYPVIYTLYRGGRLLYLRGNTMENRISSLEEVARVTVATVENISKDLKDLKNMMIELLAQKESKAAGSKIIN